MRRKALVCLLRPETQFKSILNPKLSMMNTISNPLNCIRMELNNRTDNAPKVAIKSIHKGNGTWICIGYIDGLPKCDCTSIEKAYNEACVREDLADLGYLLPANRKAPEMVIKGSFAEIIDQLDPENNA